MCVSCKGMTWRKITALRNQELEGGHKLSILLGTEWHQTKIACLSFNGPSNKSGKKDNEKIKRRGLELSSSQPSMKKHFVLWFLDDGGLDQRADSPFAVVSCTFILFVVVVYVSDFAVHSSTGMYEKIPLFEIICSYDKKTVIEVQSLLR